MLATARSGNNAHVSNYEEPAEIDGVHRFPLFPDRYAERISDRVTRLSSSISRIMRIDRERYSGVLVTKIGGNDVRWYSGSESRRCVCVPE